MKLLMKIYIAAILFIGTFSSTAFAENISFRCHENNQQRSETDLYLEFNTSSEQVTSFSFWNEISTVFWGDEVIYWTAKGNYSETSPSVAIAGFHTSTAQLIVRTITTGTFKNDVIASFQRRDTPPLNCYRSGF